MDCSPSADSFDPSNYTRYFQGYYKTTAIVYK
jgi:hypothetical protein